MLKGLPSILLSISVLMSACGNGSRQGVGINGGNSQDATPLPPLTVPGDVENCQQTQTALCQMENLVMQYTNNERAKVGLPTLKYSLRMAYAARNWSAQQAMLGSISHNGFPTQREQVIEGKFGDLLGLTLNGENVEQNFDQGSAAQTANAIVVAWMKSQGHKENILGTYQDIGVGITLKGDLVYATQLFGYDVRND